MSTTHDLVQQLVNELQGYRVAHPEHDMPALEAGWAFLSQAEQSGGAEDAPQRVRHFLQEYKRARGLDPETVHSLNTGDVEREAHLTVADLETLVTGFDNGNV